MEGKMPKCFTCKNKIGARVPDEERKRWRQQGADKWSVPELVFICAKTDLRIRQTDPSCEQYEPDAVMCEAAQSLSDLATRELSKLRGEGPAE